MFVNPVSVQFHLVSPVAPKASRHSSGFLSSARTASEQNTSCLRHKHAASASVGGFHSETDAASPPPPVGLHLPVEVRVALQRGAVVGQQLDVGAQLLQDLVGLTRRRCG